MSGKTAPLSVFEKVTEDLTNLGYRTYHLPIDKDNSVEQLLVSLQPNLGENQDSAVIQVMFLNDMLKKISDNEPTILQFFVKIPVKPDESLHLELFKLLSAFTRVTPVGHFGIGEDGLFFRHTFLMLGKEINNKIFTETIQMISFFVTTFWNKIIDLFEGKKNLQQILDETSNEMSVV